MQGLPDEVFRYKGFEGSIEYHEPSGMWSGELDDPEYLVTYEGQSRAELKRNFHEAVIDHIRYLEEQVARARAKGKT